MLKALFRLNKGMQKSLRIFTIHKAKQENHCPGICNFQKDNY